MGKTMPDELRKMDLNEATQRQLTHLQGIGEEAADKIVRYRQRYGRFFSIEDLHRVGFDEPMIEHIKDQVRV